MGLLTWLSSLTPKKTEGEFASLSFDGIPWEHPMPPKIVAVGDLHGDLKALAALCAEAGLVDNDGGWTGGKAHLVLLGDLVGGHKDSRLLLDFIIRLEKEARSQGGAVHSLLGNHDLLPIQGLLHGMTGKEKKQYDDFPKAEDAFRGKSIYAEWIRTRNSLLRLGSWLFAHAGLDTWALESDPGRINATVRAWIRYFQSAGPKPPKETRWVVGKSDMKRGSKWERGPLWNRSMKVKRRRDSYRHRPIHDPLDPQELELVLSRWHAKRLVVGHAPVDGGEILMEHPLYGERVVMVDTRISEAGGTLSALTIEGQAVTPIYLKNNKAGREIRQAQKQMSNAEPARGGWESFTRAIRDAWRRLTGS